MPYAMPKLDWGIRKTFGANLASLRGEWGLSQAQVAKVAFGSEKRWSKYHDLEAAESKVQITLADVLALAKFFDVSLDTLVGHEYSNSGADVMANGEYHELILLLIRLPEERRQSILTFAREQADRTKA